MLGMFPRILTVPNRDCNRGNYNPIKDCEYKAKGEHPNHQPSALTPKQSTCSVQASYLESLQPWDHSLESPVVAVVDLSQNPTPYTLNPMYLKLYVACPP